MTPTRAPAFARRPVPLSTTLALGPLAVLIALGLGLGIFWPVAAPAQAVPTSVSAGSTTTTVFKLSPAVQAQVDALNAQARTVQADIDKLDSELDQKAAEYNQCLADIHTANAKLSQLSGEIAGVQTDQTYREGLLDERVRAIYENRGLDQFLELLLTVRNIDEFYDRLRLVSTVADQDRRLIVDLKNNTARLNLLLKAANDQKRQEVALKNQLTQRAAEIQATSAKREQMLAALLAKVKAVIDQDRQRQIAEQERQQQLAEEVRLQQELQAKLAAAQAAAQNSGGSKTSKIARSTPNILKPEQIALVAQKAGFTGQNLVISVAVSLAESGGNANVEGDVAIGGSFGLWQVYCVAHPYLIPPNNPDSVAWNDPYQNAQWAYKISGGGNWHPWSTYNDGAYRSRMATAQAAVHLLTTNPSAVTPPVRR